MDVSTPTAEAVHRAYASHQDLSTARDIQQILQDWAQANSAREAAVAARVSGTTCLQKCASRDALPDPQ